MIVFDFFILKMSILWQTLFCARPYFVTTIFCQLSNIRTIARFLMVFFCAGMKKLSQNITSVVILSQNYVFVGLFWNNILTFSVNPNRFVTTIYQTINRVENIMQSYSFILSHSRLSYIPERIWDIFIVILCPSPLTLANLPFLNSHCTYTKTDTRCISQQMPLTY